MDISSLKSKRGQQKATVTRIEKYIEGLNITEIDSKTVFGIRARLEKLNTASVLFEEIQSGIELLVEDDEQKKQEEEKYRNEFEESYYNVFGELKDIIEKFESQQLGQSATSNESHTSRVKLPTIELPTFDGQFNNWVPFRDTFKSLIHEQQYLSKVEKLHYLKASLKGEASSLLDSIKISEDNYETAFQALIDRYENKKLLIHHHLQSIMETQSIERDSLGGLRRLVDELKGNIAILETLGVDTKNWDPLLLYVISKKIDEKTRNEWEAKTCTKDLPTLKEFYEFVNYRAQYLEKINNQRQIPMSKSSSKVTGTLKSNYKQAPVKAFLAESKREACLHCSEQHPLYICKGFLELPIASRRETVKQLKLCYNCLKPRHSSKVCIAGGCKKCGSKHNTLLHLETKPVQVSQQSSGSVPTITSTHTLNNAEVLLSTAVVNIIDEKGAIHTARALLDSGSQGNFVSKELVDKLQMSPQKIRQPVKGINHTSVEITKIIDLEVQSRINGYRAKSSFLIIDKITDHLPQNAINIQAWEIPENIILADPKFATPGKIDILLGASIFWELLCVGQIRLNNGRIIFQKTRLGWIVSGSIPLKQRSQRKNLSCNFSSLNDQIERFWNLDDIMDSTITHEETEFETHFQNTVHRRNDGRFEVGLPIKSNIIHLGNSEANALRRLSSLEKRLSKSSEMKEKYIQFMQEYEQLGHMTKIPEDETEPTPVYYLPHHGVLKEDSITTKLRVVFDGSAKTDTGISLNDILMSGSQLQSDLCSILLRFRKHSIVITSDIEKMYRQIYISQENRDLQRIMWRSSPEEPISKYRLNTITYGTRCGSFLAIRCLYEIAKQLEEKVPDISRIIAQDFYVDDLLSGGETVEEVLCISKLLTENLAQYGLGLRKWNSNHPAVLKEVRQGTSELKHLVIEDSLSKTLGVLWDARKDLLQYSVNDDPKMGNTKRAVIAAIAQIFDPLGLIGPVTVKAKILMQELWKQNLDWDEPLPQELFTQWRRFQINWKYIKQIKAPRHAIVENSSEIEMHGFCDASESAYGACIYLRSINKTGRVVVRLLFAKSRVAPLKVITLPRLELCGALLLSKLIKKVRDSMRMVVSKTFLWTDSIIVLAWLAREPTHWRTFVANRVSQIQQLTKECQWSHVSGKENPADIISRGMDADQLITNQLWWNGPTWLELSSSDWPKYATPNDSQEIPEVRKTLTVLNCTITNTLITDILNKYSSFKKLQCVVAYIFRFYYNITKGNVKKTGALEPQELETALCKIVKWVQAETFPVEIANIRSGKSIPKHSKILSLNPIIDNQGILRVGGRLSKADIDFDKKHQMILPGSHFVTELIIKNEHHKQLHAGARTLLCSLRLKFWIIGGINAVKKQLRICITCIRSSPKMYEYRMGDLPKERITPALPFQICGVDYAGPLDVKNSGLRTTKILKVYICLFVCFVTKAVHIELAVDLTTDAFIRALKRFIARRGKPAKLYSDNGKNFIGAKNKMIDIKRLSQWTAQEEIHWHFIPPRAPHFGGLWEAAIKSTKRHLKKTIGATVLTFEELYTLLVQIEGCLNSRPISPLSSDPGDLQALTPAHFLIGRHLAAIPEQDLQDVPTNRLARYQLVTKILQDFWARWRREYLNEMQHRSKWKSGNLRQPKEGELVIIHEQSLPPYQWRLGRIIKVHPGKDGIIRVAEVRTTAGTFSRSIQQLCPLQIS